MDAKERRGMNPPTLVPHIFGVYHKDAEHTIFNDAMRIFAPEPCTADAFAKQVVVDLLRVGNCPVEYHKIGGMTYAVYGTSSIDYVHQLLKQIKQMEEVQNGLNQKSRSSDSSEM
jgi:hypothetical protein